MGEGQRPILQGQEVGCGEQEVIKILQLPASHFPPPIMLGLLRLTWPCCQRTTTKRKYSVTRILSDSIACSTQTVLSRSRQKKNKTERRLLFLLFLFALGFTACSADHGSVVFEKAEKQFSKGEIDVALTQYQYVVDKYPESAFAPKSQYRIAQIYNHNFRDKKKAMEAYSTLFFMYPNSPDTIDARADIAAIYAASGEHRLAIDQYQKLITENPTGYKDFQYKIAMEYILLNDFSQARVEFAELLGRASGELVPEIEYQIANTYYIEGNLKDAIERFEKIISRFPDSPFALNAKLGIAKSYSETGKLGEAMVLLNELKDKYSNKAAVDIMIDAIQVRLDERPGSKKHQAPMSFDEGHGSKRRATSKAAEPQHDKQVASGEPVKSASSPAQPAVSSAQTDSTLSQPVLNTVK